MASFPLRAAAELALLLRTAARAEIMPRFRRLAAGDVRAKTGPLDLVTEADEAAERVITSGLERIFPGCVVVGEEAASADASVLARLPDADLAFVVDPVDGTANYAAGLPLFGTMAAVVMRGEVVCGVIHDPVGDDTAIALRGEGAWIETPEGTRTDLRVAEAAPLGRMTGAASWRHMPPDLRGAVYANLPKVAASWDFRCAAHEYRMVAAGHCHYLLFYRLMPWDHAPGWLLHREAGGYAKRLDGSEYSPLETRGGLLMAPDEASFRMLRDTLLAGAAAG